MGKGVRQDCILSPCLSNLYAEYIVGDAGLDEAQAGIKIAGRNINNLRYADEIKRHLLLGRKAITNLDSILITRDITLQTKVHIVKAVVFSVVMYGCENWTIKKANTKELMFLDCAAGEDS